MARQTARLFARLFARPPVFLLKHNKTAKKTGKKRGIAGNFPINCNYFAFYCNFFRVLFVDIIFFCNFVPEKITIKHKPNINRPKRGTKNKVL